LNINNTTPNCPAQVSERVPVDVHHLVTELDHYKRRSEWLLTINGLHARLAAALGIESMVEAFSIWLMPLFGHDLLAYHNPDRQRTYLFCSLHGPDRRAAHQITGQLFSQMAEGRVLPARVGGYYVASWPLTYRREKGYLLLLRRSPIIAVSEVRVVEATLEILTESLQRALDYEDLYDQARLDTLTGLANRRVLAERLRPLIEGARRHGHPLTLASMDLDKFKQINDTCGHAKGDEVLRLVAATLGEMIRQNDLLVRMGGDEFILVLPDTTLQAAGILAERLCRAVNGLAITLESRLGISIGLSQWGQDYSMDEWLQRADENLYKAKAAGGNQVCAI
jgi:diguanylate cyclase (GGDEF)-like protein